MRPSQRAALDHNERAVASIKLSGIDKTFPGVKALDNINLEISSGEFFTLLGPSGCGKTTLLRTIAGFYRQDRGQVSINEKVIDNIPAHLRDTGMVFQNYAVFPHMTVFENVAFGLRNRKVSPAEIKKRVAKSLEMARLSGYEGRTPDQLSGGQQQRVGLARAMVIEPQVLLMDEPLSNLDAKLRVEMREEIRDIQRELGITTVYVTHDQEEALVISDRIAVMDAGVIQQVGPAWEIYKQPVNTFVASFVGHMNFLEGEIVSAGKDFIEIAIEGNRVRAPKPAREVKKVRLSFRPEDLIISQAGPDEGAEEEPAKKSPGEDGFSLLSGIIQKSTFTGSLVQYGIECGPGLNLVVERHKPEKEALIPPGSSVLVKIPPGSVMTFDPDSGERLWRRPL